MSRTVIELPFPPSVNGLYNGGMKTKRRFKSDEYKAWELHAGLVLNTQRHLITPHPGKVVIRLVFGRPDSRRRDVANYEKAVSDFLVSHGIIKDDCLIESTTQRWGKIPPGVHITIRNLHEEA